MWNPLSPQGKLVFKSNWFTTTIFWNRKHVLCFYQVVEKQMEVWRTRNALGTQADRWVFPQLFGVLPSFHKCSRNMENIFPISFRKWSDKNKKATCLLFAFTIVTWTAHATCTCSFLLISSYRNTILNQCNRTTCFLGAIF